MAEAPQAAEVIQRGPLAVCAELPLSRRAAARYRGKPCRFPPGWVSPLGGVLPPKGAPRKGGFQRGETKAGERQGLRRPPLHCAEATRSRRRLTLPSPPRGGISDCKFQISEDCRMWWIDMGSGSQERSVEVAAATRRRHLWGDWPHYAKASRGGRDACVSRQRDPPSP